MHTTYVCRCIYYVAGPMMAIDVFFVPQVLDVFGFLVPCFPASFLLLCLTCSFLHFLSFLYVLSFLSLLLCFLSYSFLLPIYFHYFTFSSFSVFAALLPDPLLLCFLSLRSLRFSFALFYPVSSMTPWRNPKRHPKETLDDTLKKK